MEARIVAIHTGGLEDEYEQVGFVSAKRSKASLYSSSPTIEDVNSELQQKAAQLGANAVLNVTYSRGMSLFSYEVLKAVGTAVRVQSDERDCPFCAEKIKRKASVCKHCKSELSVPA